MKIINSSIVFKISNPHKCGFDLLRDPEKTSNFWIKFPLKVDRCGVGGQKIGINSGKLEIYVKNALYQLLIKAKFVIWHPKELLEVKRAKINYRELAVSYQSLIDAGVCDTQADIARHLGVSRAWVTKVFRSADTHYKLNAIPKSV